MSLVCVACVASVRARRRPAPDYIRAGQLQYGDEVAIDQSVRRLSLKDGLGLRLVIMYRLIRLLALIHECTCAYIASMVNPSSCRLSQFNLSGVSIQL